MRRAVLLDVGHALKKQVFRITPDCTHSTPLLCPPTCGVRYSLMLAMRWMASCSCSARSCSCGAGGAGGTQTVGIELHSIS